MKILIAIVNCRSRRDWANAIRNTWLPQVPESRADVRFFVGRGDPQVFPADTIELDCDDSYQGLPDKIRSIVRWAYENGYDYVMKLDDDVVIRPEALLNSGFDNHDYSGRFNRSPNIDSPFVVPMGFAYWISRRCMEFIKDYELPVNSNDDEYWVAKIMHENGVHLSGDERYQLHVGTLVERPYHPFRPLNHLRPGYHSAPGTFAYCMFLEGNSGTSISTEEKISEFLRVFSDRSKN